MHVNFKFFNAFFCVLLKLTTSAQIASQYPIVKLERVKI